MKITILGGVFFIVLGVAFFAWFGGPPTIQPSMAIGRAWLYCSLLFVAGAGTACFGDQEYGMFPPTSLRWLFIVLGIFIMAVSSAWMHALTKTWTRDSSAVLLPTPNQTQPVGGSVKGFSIGDQSFSCGGSARATAEWNLMLPQRRA